MKQLIMIALLILFGCAKQECIVEIDGHDYNCDVHNYIKLKSIEQSVEINVSVATDRIKLFHNGTYHSSIWTNGTICNGQSVSSSSWNSGDVVSVAIDNGNYADEMVIE